jgi:HSP20 family molecular chaperone IbpA
MATQLAPPMVRRVETEPVQHDSKEMFRQYSQIYDAIALRAFEIFESNGSSPGHDLEDWLRAESELLQPVPLNVLESNSEFVVRAGVPAFGSNEIEISVEPRCLAISGKRETKEEEEKGKMIRSEWCADRMFRALNLPSDVDPSKVSIALKDGVLTINLPKAPDPK